MQNFYAIESEANFLRHDREQRAAAELRADLALPPRRRIPWPQLSRLVLARLRSITAPLVRLQEPWFTKAGTRLPRAP